MIIANPIYDANDTIRNQMDAEDEMERIYDREIRKRLMEQEEKFKKELEDIVTEKDNIIENLQRQLNELKNK